METEKHYQFDYDDNNFTNIINIDKDDDSILFNPTISLSETRINTFSTDSNKENEQVTIIDGIDKFMYSEITEIFQGSVERYCSLCSDNNHYLKNVIIKDNGKIELKDYFKTGRKEVNVSIDFDIEKVERVISNYYQSISKKVDYGENLIIPNQESLVSIVFNEFDKLTNYYNAKKIFISETENIHDSKRNSESIRKFVNTIIKSNFIKHEDINITFGFGIDKAIYIYF